MWTEDRGIGFDLELDGCQSLLEVGAIAGKCGYRKKPKGSVAEALAGLDAFAADAEFVFGHNILWHDLPWIARHAPALALLQKPAVDTLVLSAIAFAEHPYHKLLKDYKVVREAANDPVADARIAARLLRDARERLGETAKANPVFGRVVRSLGERGLAAIGATASAGFAVAFAGIAEPAADLDSDFVELLAERACATAVEALLPLAEQSEDVCLALLFAVAWLRVASTHAATSPSVVMPWVRHKLPRVAELLRTLRDAPCRRAVCRWCRQVHDPVAQLQRWFRYPDFRSTPTLKGDGRPAQRAIVEAGFADRPHLALLPTGGGKSLCFQLPAIQRYLRRGCLTVVISPLQALMHDQVDNFVSKTNAQCAVALTGRLTPPERRAALDAVRMGRAGLLYVSPEQLRNPTFRKAVALREIGAWVFDEAHCLSKWGHDFRPDYLYAARFVREFSEHQGTQPAPIVCVTATARPEVRDEILAHFRNELGQELEVFDGHAPRENLTLCVENVAGQDKVARLRELVAEQLATAPTGSVLVYAATRGRAEKTAGLLQASGIEAEAFHAGLDVPTKKEVQQRFLDGTTRVVCATNAFGMGIDKPDIRLVVHFEIPGSLEAYVQEVGRAGRDGRPADAVLLFAPDDIETQFRLASMSRLDLRDLRGILRRIRRLARPARAPGGGASTVREAVCTTGEILRDEALTETVDPSDRGAPTRVVTAVAWLERGKFLRRDENATAVFQGRPIVKTLAEAKQRIHSLRLPERKAAAWLAILSRLINATADAGFSSDDFLGLPEVLGVVDAHAGAASGRAILRILIEMQKARLLSSGVQMTAFVRHGVAGSSRLRFERAAAMEWSILDVLRESEPDPDDHQHYPLSLRMLTQRLARSDETTTVAEVQQILAAMADRAQHANQRAPGVRLWFTSAEHCRVQVQGGWDQILDGARRRRAVAEVCLQSLIDLLPDAKARGGSLLVQFSLDQLLAAMDRDLVLRSAPSPDPATEVEYALLFLHRIEAIVLHKGLAVFRQAMVLRLPPEEKPRRFTRNDFLPLGRHQDERVVQIHVMHEFARRMAETAAGGLELLDDYFCMPRDQFLERYFKQRLGELQRATGPESWGRIVTGLSRDQRRVVEAGVDESLLVLAGPGSGKTRVVVHRCAYLLRVKRVPARAILVLCFNRSAAVELRDRLRKLVGEDARGVLVQTYHGMAARLVGRTPADLIDAGRAKGDVFDELMKTAVGRLEAGSADEREADGDELRDRLLVGFRYILVDEYQDIDERQYQLVSAIAGRTLRDADRKLCVLAVGDDDQNIYEFRHASVEFLRRFEDDYAAKRVPLVENYRSTAHILTAANQLIALNQDRLKRDTPIRVNEARCSDPPGGPFAGLDREGEGRVRIVAIETLAEQAGAVLGELRRIEACDPDFAWDRCAVLGSEHRLLDAARAALERASIPVRRRVAPERSYSLFRLREVQAFLDAVAEHGTEIDADVLRVELQRLREQFPREANVEFVAETVKAFVADQGEHALPTVSVREFFGELLQEQRRDRTVGSGVMLSTVHGSKGAEYHHVVLLDGGWHLRGRDSLEQ
ncbi:MAG TPA: RecQ family ATP-dependent DNA helicase, partial [bacterium]|nr:RecQ family ATP-dependent DNA helicase [bacterium]